MRLTFDRGTVVLTKDGESLDLATIPGVLWDVRVGVHRVPPYRCSALVAELRTKGVLVTDETGSYVRPPDGAFSGPTLRDYQETALKLWEAAGCRGAIVLPTGSGKTSVAVGAMARSRLPTLCLVPTRVLLHQWRATVAQHYGGAIGILGDLPGERIVISPLAIPSPTEGIQRTNLALAQSMLFRATSVRVRAEGGMRPLVRLAKLRGLICAVSTPPGETAPFLEVSGPYALFRRTLLYGRALAGIVPPLVASGRFWLRATCVVRGQALDFALATGDPVSAPEQGRHFDSKLEERFVRDFRKAAPDWDVIREPEPVRAGAGLVFPDFLLRHRQDPTRRFLVEIVGFWTREYLEKKFAALRKANIDNLIICVDAERGCSEGELPIGARVVRFKRKIDPAAVLALATHASSHGSLSRPTQ